MLKALAMALALLLAPAVGMAEATVEKTKEAQAEWKKKLTKKRAKPNKGAKKPAAKAAAPTHDHSEGAWVCKLAKVPPPGHACTYHSDKPGKCGWCGGDMVRVEDLK